MAISATSANSSTNAATNKTASSANQVAMNGDTFMKLFTQQISNQNPMDPMKSEDFLNQFAQVTSVQTMGSLQSTLSNLSSVLDSMLSSQQQSTAQGLVGKNVTYSGAGGTKTGVVSSVELAVGKPPVLVLQDGTKASLDTVKQIA